MGIIRINRSRLFSLAEKAAKKKLTKRNGEEKDRGDSALPHPAPPFAKGGRKLAEKTVRGCSPLTIPP